LALPQVRSCGPTINDQLSAISYQLSAINYQLSTINYQLSTINDQAVGNCCLGIAVMH
jgi:hypothetical protein